VARWKPRIGGADVECPQENLDGVLAVLPALKKPTISTLSDGEWVAVNTVIEESEAWQVIPRLKAAQAQGIVEYPLNRW
jgi:ATP phosphoribosyltransferase